MHRDRKGTILVAPHHFPDLNREEALASELGYELVAASDTDAFRAALPDAEIVMITPYARLEEHDFGALGRCRAVIRYGIGYDNIDVAAASRAGIPVSIVPDASSEEVASHALAMGLALARRLPAGSGAIQSGQWAGNVGFDTPVLSEIQVGVVGMGRIGQLVARMWTGIGARVSAYDPFVVDGPIEMTDLQTVLQESDVVSLHLPLTPETHHLLDAVAIARMRAGSVIVNVSRGGLVDEVALSDALRDGRIAGAGIDTFAHEPLPLDSPLRDAPNTILTPHIAWRSTRATARLQTAAVARARLALAGEPLIDLVN